MSNAAAATHAVLYRSGRPIRVAAVTDWQALADMRSAASMSIGIYTVAEVSARAARDAEDAIAGVRSAYAVLASPVWQTVRAA